MTTRLAVDLGASSGRVIRGRFYRGRLTTEEIARFANVPVRVPGAAPSPPTLRWDVLRLWDGIASGLHDAARTGPVSTVGVDTWAVDYGLLDSRGQLLGNPVHYRDERTAGAPEKYFAVDPAEELYRRTGTQVQPFNTLFQLTAEQEEAAGTGEGSAGGLEESRRALLMPDLLTFWLTGIQRSEITNMSTSGMIDPASRSWDPVTVDVLKREWGVDAASLFPSLIEPGAFVGPLDAARCAMSGSAASAYADTRVIAVGSHDTASAVAAVPILTDDAAYISSGTWSLVGLELDGPVLTEASRKANFTNELGVFGTVRYLRNVAGLWLLQESLRTWREQGHEYDLAALLAAAAQIPPLQCVIDVDNPGFATPGDMPARIAQVAATGGEPVPTTPAQVVRTICDSLALAYRCALRAASRLSGRSIGVVHIVGGGSRNELLCQLTADATGLPVIAGPAEGTAIGNLLVQASADGEIPAGLPALREVVAASCQLRRYEPQGEEADWDKAEGRLPL